MMDFYIHKNEWKNRISTFIWKIYLQKCLFLSEVSDNIWLYQVTILICKYLFLKKKKKKKKR